LRESLLELHVGRPRGVAKNEHIAITAGNAVEASGDRRRGEAPMALDYKNRPAIVTSPRDDAGFCPECGQLLRLRPPPAPAPPARHPGWSGLLVAVGIYLLVTFGPSAWDAHQAIAATDRALPQLTDCSSQRLGDEGCAPTVALGTARALAIQAARGVAQQRADRDLDVVGAGLLAVLVGLGTLARRRVRPGPRGWLPATLLGLWASGESLVLALLCLLLGGYIYLLAGRLAAGWPLTWAVADQTTNRIVALIFEVAQLG
jgi:hypothetical protein